MRYAPTNESGFPGVARFRREMAAQMTDRSGLSRGIRCRPIGWLVTISLFAPLGAHANAGTPLMWASLLHLLFGNLLIGVAEGLLLVWFFQAPKGRAIGCMIVANYISAWAGALFLSGSAVRALDLDLNNAWRWFWILAGVAYLLTLVLEWPFVAYAVRGKSQTWRRSVLASLLVQTASYLVLFGWYWLASGTSLYRRMHVVPASELSLPANLTLYFLGAEDGLVRKRRLAVGTEEMVLASLISTNRQDRLFVKPSSASSETWDVVARLERGASREFEEVVVVSNLLADAVQDTRAGHTDPPEHPNTWFNFGTVPRLGASSTSNWDGWVGFWPMEGVELTHQGTKEVLHFAYETSFGAWAMRNAILLPGDFLVFQFGDRQICAAEISTRRVALLARGRGPVVLEEKSSGGPKVSGKTGR